MPVRHPDAQILDELRARVAAIEGASLGGDGDAAPLGLAAIDGALPWGGLPRGALHEIFAPADAAAPAAGVAAAFAARLSQGRAVLWIGTGLPPHAPGLAPFGLAADQLLLVRTRRTRETWWAVEEALGCPDLGAVWTEGPGLDFRHSRRLQLAAADSGVACLLVRPDPRPADGRSRPAAGETRALPPSAAVTRWRAVLAPSTAKADGSGVPPCGPPCWRLALLRGRGAKPRNWLVEWDHATGTFALAAEAGRRPDRQAAA